MAQHPDLVTVNEREFENLIDRRGPAHQAPVRRVQVEDQGPCLQLH